MSSRPTRKRPNAQVATDSRTSSPDRSAEVDVANKRMRADTEKITTASDSSDVDTISTSTSPPTQTHGQPEIKDTTAVNSSEAVDAAATSVTIGSTIVPSVAETNHANALPLNATAEEGPVSNATVYLEDIAVSGHPAAHHKSTVPAISDSVSPISVVLDDWVPRSVLERVASFGTVNDAAKCRFALMHVPFHADWGTSVGNVDLSRYFVVDGKIATILLIGAVTSRWFVDNNGGAVSPVRIGITPAREADAEAARRILAHSKPARVPPPGPLYATRFMTEWSDDEYAEKPDILPWLNTYDVTVKGQRAVKPPRAIQVGDIVVVETLLVRYKSKINGKTAKNWEAFKTTFELQTVNILAHPPKTAKVAPSAMDSTSGDLEF